MRTGLGERYVFAVDIYTKRCGTCGSPTMNCLYKSATYPHFAQEGAAAETSCKT